MWLVSVAVALAFGLIFYHSQENSQTQHVDDELRAIAQLKADQITEWRAQRYGDAAEMMESPYLEEGINKWLENPDRENTDAIRKRFESLVKHFKYSDVAFFGANGVSKLEFDKGRDILSREEMAAMTQAFRENGPVLTDLILHPAKGNGPYLDTIVPFYTTKNGKREPLGAIVLESDASRFLYPLLKTWPVPTETAETLLVRKDDDSVLFLNDTRFERGTAMTMRIPLTQTDVPAVMAVLGKEGLVEGRDYRGAAVLAVLKKIPDSTWFLIAKMDRDDAFSGWYSASVMIMGLVLLFIFGATAVAGVVWQRNTKQQYEALLSAKGALYESEGRHRATLLSIGDAVIATNAHGRVEIMNPVAEKLTGWKEHEARGKHLYRVFNIVNEKTREPLKSPLEWTISRRSSIGAGTAILISRDGAERPIADSGAPIYAPDGSIAGVVLVFRDQSAERAAQVALQQSEALLAETGRIAKVGGWEYDVETRELVWTDEVYNIFEIEDTLSPTAEGALEFYSPECRPLIQEAFRRAVEEKEPFDVEVEIITARGNSRWANMIGNMDRSRNRIYGIFHDITERRQAEIEREKLSEQLLQSQKMEAIGQLAGGMAHDFNNMLGVVLGAAQLAIQELQKNSDPSAEHELIIDTALRARELTLKLLSFARADKPVLRPELCEKTVGGLVEMLKRTLSKKITIETRFSDEPLACMMDAGQIQQALLNICNNAADAMPDGGCLTIETFSAHLENEISVDGEISQTGRYCAIKISDTGAGIDPASLGKIFDPFYTTKGVGKGTGLGLSVTHGIARSHGGRVTVESRPGEGASVTLYIPLTEMPEAGEEASETRLSWRTSSGTILMVDDEATLLKLTSRLLESRGYKVLTSESPLEAIEIYRNEMSGINIVVLDYMMPEMDGGELLEELKKLNPGVKALIASGYSDFGGEEKLLDIGAAGFIQKPFEVDNLCDAIDSILSRA